MWNSFGSVSKLSSNLCFWSFGLVFFKIHFHQRRHEEEERYITGLKANLKKLCRSVISCWRDLTERRLSSQNILQSYTMSTLACTLINRSLSDSSTFHSLSSGCRRTLICSEQFDWFVDGDVAAQLARPVVEHDVNIISSVCRPFIDFESC